MWLRQGINMTALREIKLLRELEDPHILRLLDVFPHKGNLALVRGTPCWPYKGPHLSEPLPWKPSRIALPLHA